VTVPMGTTPPTDPTLAQNTYADSPYVQPKPPRRLTRPRDNRWIGGVCAGLGRRFGMAPNMVRILFVLSCLLPGPQFLLYLMLWIIMPNEDAPAR